MKRLIPLALALAAPLTAQDAGYWKATSKTAMSITGDIAISAEKLTINFNTFTIAELRTLKPEEINATFNAEASEPGGHLYRLNIPAKRPFLHKNTLCGAEDTTFMATWVNGKTLQLAFFAGAKMPTMSTEAYTNETNLCGTYMYTR